MTRVVITGLGAITPLGNDVDTFWQNMKAGESGADVIRTFDTTDYVIRIACEVKDFNPTDWMDRKTAKRMARSTQFSVAAARQAIADAGLEITEDNASRVGVVINTGGGGVSIMEEAQMQLVNNGPKSVSPFLVPMVMANAASCLVSIELGAAGPVNTSTLACASGNYALVDAYYMMQRGEADVILAGGVEAAISPLIIASFGRMGALSQRNDDPKRASRPFDKNRDGFVFGEGGVVFVLETEEHAKARGAKIYAEVFGGALRADAYHLTAPKPDASGAAGAMKRALENAGKSPDEVDAVFAHGTSTPLGDVAETLAIKKVFGERAYQIPVTATKSQVGHMLGGAGAVSALAAVKTIEEGIICPTINYETPDPECDLDYVPNEARAVDVNLALVNAFGFGGQDVVLVLGKYQNGQG
ncbi:MAG: beta-ketoacyl-[acyl-carrier-protein] synthase II [Chloroflexi bacterium]|nr:MAG: beta-ketoacyl-[acyl-carrier-protein] synthase II [Chloroflexota bacterium]